MVKETFSAITLTAIEAAKNAGEILKKGFGTIYEISTKPGRQNFVTEFDRASEACIISTIKERFPRHNFLAEESGSTMHSDMDNILWIIDPLDGTANFARHLPIFTISIAAYQNEKVLCGVIFQPFTQELFVAERGKGSFLNGAQISVSQVNQMNECIVVASSPYDQTLSPTLNFKKLIELSFEGASFRNLGSAALALAYIAAGKIDALCMYNLYPWDFAAGQLLIEEAGGLLTLYQKDPTFFYSPSTILAGNHKIHPLLKNYLFHSSQEGK